MNIWDQKRTIIRRYDLTAKIYDMRYAKEQRAKYLTALGHLIARQGSILDVGCGSGLLFSHVEGKAQTIVGIDFSRMLLLQAKERAQEFRNVHLVQADADHLPFKDQSFCSAFAFTVLQNLPIPLHTLEEIKRITERDAYIVVTGLKKAFSLQAFKVFLRNTGLQVVYLEDSAVKCYIAVMMQSQS